jgi:hypothetical protein
MVAVNKLASSLSSFRRRALRHSGKVVGARALRPGYSRFGLFWLAQPLPDVFQTLFRRVFGVTIKGEPVRCISRPDAKTVVFDAMSWPRTANVITLDLAVKGSRQLL